MIMKCLNESIFPSHSFLQVLSLESWSLWLDGRCVVEVVDEVEFGL